MNRGALVACYFRAHIATDSSAQVRLVIFHHIARNGSFHFATNGRRQISANVIGHIFRSLIGDVPGFIGNRAACCT